MKNLYEIFDEVAQRTTREDKIAVLRYNASYALREVLRGTFHPDIKFVIERVPYYTPSDSPPGMGYTSINQELKRVYLFEENNSMVSPFLSMDRKEKLLIQMLEALEKREADVFMNMLLKDLRVPGLDYDLVKEAFPDLLP